VLLHYQLAIWPSRFVASLRALRFAWRIVHLMWVGQLIKNAWHQKNRTRAKPFFEHGPVKYLSDTLAEFKLTWDDVMTEQHTPPSGESPKGAQLEWYELCRQRVCAEAPSTI
jgi:hypothetical protein